ncbi:hypothetical protein [Actinoplanes sp. NPDC049316]|uniref:hypothetical protein n=1 Tax=Actinoplanes sp. NPDC049316 TaxID=3154727 RepID=UPI0034379659
MSSDRAERWVPDSPEFLAAQHRAAARDGVLSGRYVLVDGDLLRQAYGSWSPQGVRVVTTAGSPGAGEDFPGFWTAVVPHEHVALAVSFTTTARHRDGGVLQLRAPAGAGVRAVWWRGENDDAAHTIPAGFVWEKNDDYYHGTVEWEDLGDVTVAVRFHPR